MSKKPSTAKLRKRVNRSINFDKDVLHTVVTAASKERRSVSWMVNECVRRELASPATT